MSTLPSRPEVPDDVTAPFSRPWLKSLRSAKHKIEGKVALMPGHSVTADQRMEMRRLATGLKSMLSSNATHREMAVILFRLFSPYDNAGGKALDERERKMRMETYLDAIKRFPAWVIKEQVDHFLAGETGLNGSFVPKPPELAGLCRARFSLASVDLHDLEELIEARTAAEVQAEIVEAEATNQYISDGLADLRAALIRDMEEDNAEAEARRAETNARIAEWEERERVKGCEEAGIAPSLGVSPQLARQLAKHFPLTGVPNNGELPEAD